MICSFVIRPNTNNKINPLPTALLLDIIRFTYITSVTHSKIHLRLKTT